VADVADQRGFQTNWLYRFLREQAADYADLHRQNLRNLRNLRMKMRQLLESQQIEWA
jgi:hypothetical protein